MGSPELHEARIDAWSAVDLHAVLRLRAEVFVVEQASPYLDLDGRDLAPSTRHVWLGSARPGDGLEAYLRVLAEPEGHRIGRVVTRASARGQGLAGRLLDHVLATTPGPLALEAQAHLVGWYARWGFAPDGPPTLLDGIAHVPMAR